MFDNLPNPPKPLLHSYEKKAMMLQEVAKFLRSIGEK